MRRKGFENIYLIITVIAVGAGVTMLAGVLPGLVDAKMAENAWTLRSTSHALSLSTSASDHAVPDAINWSMPAAAIDLGQEGGGQEDWSPSNMPSASFVEGELEDAATTMFTDDYLGGPFPASICQIDTGDGAISVTDRTGSAAGTPGINYTFTASRPVSVNCTAVTGAARVGVPVEREHFSAGNRYFPLYQDTRAALQAVADSWSSNVADSQTGSGSSSCGGSASDARSSARDSAESAVESDVESAMNTGLNDHPGTDGFSISTKDLEVSTSSTITDQPESSDCCDEYGEDEDGNTVCVDEDTEWSGAEAEASPTSADLELGIQDDDYTVWGEDGRTNIEFRVPEFSYSFD